MPTLLNYFFILLTVVFIRLFIKSVFVKCPWVFWKMLKDKMYYYDMIVYDMINMALIVQIQWRVTELILNMSNITTAHEMLFILQTLIRRPLYRFILIIKLYKKGYLQHWILSYLLQGAATSDLMGIILNTSGRKSFKLVSTQEVWNVFEQQSVCCSILSSQEPIPEMTTKRLRLCIIWFERYCAWLTP